MSEFDCIDCGASSREVAIHRVNKKGEPFRGKCQACLTGKPSATSQEGAIMEALNGPEALS